MAGRNSTPRPRKTSPSELPRAEVTAEDGVKPLFALHKITYGNAQTAPSKSIFTPVSETERLELLGIGAARELDDVETVLAGASAAPAADSEDEPIA